MILCFLSEVQGEFPQRLSSEGYKGTELSVLLYLEKTGSERTIHVFEGVVNPSRKTQQAPNGIWKDHSDGAGAPAPATE